MDLSKGLTVPSRFLQDSERVFVLRCSPEEIILEASANTARILREPDLPLGRALREVFLPGIPGRFSFAPGEVSQAARSAPVLAHLGPNGRLCRVLSRPLAGGIQVWVEVVGDAATSGLTEMSGLLGQIQSLLEQVQRQHDQLRTDLRAAAWLQERFLPRQKTFPGVRLEWLFRPGDLFHWFPLPDGTSAGYLLDVSGHGVPAALIGVSAAQAMTALVSMAPPDSPPRPFQIPDILGRLEEEFPLDRFGLYFTMVFLHVDPRSGTLTWSVAGHPPPIMVPAPAGDRPATVMPGGGPFIGMGLAETIGQETMTVRPGDRVYLYSDGLTDRRNPALEGFGRDRLLACLQAGARRSLADSVAETARRSLADSVAETVAANDRFAEGRREEDDLTLLGVEFTAPSQPEPTPASQSC